MYNTFNMGIGMVIAVAPEQVKEALEAISQAGETPYVIGEVKAGEKGVTVC
jgi:phosphoribosylformylglycinamidine cyclo-ligase